MTTFDATDPYRTMRLRVFSERLPMIRGHGIEMYASYHDVDGYYALQPVSAENTEPTQKAKPFLTLIDSEAQALCDSLWDAGIRPTNGEGSVGQLGAVKEHLADMKQIVFHALKIKEAD